MLSDVSVGCGRTDTDGIVESVVGVVAEGGGGMLMERVLGLMGWTGRWCVWYQERTGLKR